ncbi:MAG: 2-oxoglutarate dehydrogenase, E2 component, dihydrolipoamide succinyltransferase [Acidobacteria bacterium]|nr:2-oxoglutarate dehydrogenase, E2 component, dihydrolipoamide succinyltransferase [Acidobacteriota bacterium]MCW5949994.1 2-oxoglutarate dehydrogenase, E2 component, dihydrolipoamide succinyltransferase [Pyrinomonadaceae bacterium]
MSVEVVMPQMGESITEGTVSKWLKQVGDTIEKDEAILEISTDKVDAEVPSPGAGVLLEIRHQEGETVEVGTVLAIVGAAGDQPAAAPQPAVEPQAEEPPPVEMTAASEPEPEAIPAEPVSEQPVAAPATPASSEGAVEVVMPQMGESITEGTVSKWLKAVGDDIDKDEPLLEISTDKVDAEVPSPAAGKVVAINVQEGQTVEVGSVLALVGSGTAVAASPKPAPPEASAPEAPKPAPPTLPAPIAAAATASSNGSTVDELRRIKSSPLVRNIAKEHGIDITRIAGSGISGRVTKGDILNFIETGAALRPQDLLVKGAPALPVAQPKASQPVAATFVPPPPTTTMEDRVEKMSVMRKKISEHMTFSKQTSAHVTSVYEIDMTNVARFRKANQEAFQAKYGTKLTFMPFIFQAVTAAIREHRILNSQVDGDNIIYKGNINLGMAVALDWGLIVPVIKNAETMTLAEIAVKANDLADRARAKKLNPDEVQGGTFTITNPGVFGGLYGTPIINQPQVAILCVGTIEKRAKVLTSPDGDDYIAIRQMAYFALTYDHRVVDGADAEKFLSSMKRYLEQAQFEI